MATAKLCTCQSCANLQDIQELLTTTLTELSIGESLDVERERITIQTLDALRTSIAFSHVALSEQQTNGAAVSGFHTIYSGRKADCLLVYPSRFTHPCGQCLSYYSMRSLCPTQPQLHRGTSMQPLPGQRSTMHSPLVPSKYLQAVRRRFLQIRSRGRATGR